MHSCPKFRNHVNSSGKKRRSKIFSLKPLYFLNFSTTHFLKLQILKGNPQGLWSQKRNLHNIDEDINVQNMWISKFYWNISDFFALWTNDNNSEEFIHSWFEWKNHLLALDRKACVQFVSRLQAIVWMESPAIIILDSVDNRRYFRILHQF